MFRPMRRFKQQISEAECIRILKEQPRGVLSLIGDDGYPYGVPLSFVRIGATLVFHCAATGHKIDAVKAHPQASFTVVVTQLFNVRPCVKSSTLVFRPNAEGSMNTTSLSVT